MFTTGSKLFLAASTLAIAALLILGVTNAGDVGWTATVSLAGAMVALLFLTGVNLYTCDSNVSAMDPTAATASAAAQRAPGRSFWPIIGGLGVALIAVGLVTAPVVFKAGIVVLLAVLLEWMVQAWSERASADTTYNAGVRKRLLQPLEFPVLAAVGLGVIIYSFSRIMLYVSKDAGPAVFGILATLLLLGGVLLAYSPSLKQGVAIGICAIAGLGLVSTGAVMAIGGQREITTHETIANDPAICSSNDETEADHNASQSVAAKSNVSARVTLHDGALSASAVGRGSSLDTITLQRANPSNIIFINLDAEPVRLTAQIGRDTPVFTCTSLVEAGGSQFLTLRIPQSTPFGTETPYTLGVPGLESSTIKIVVP